MNRHVGLVGCGRWGANILRDLVTLGCRVTVVARSEESRARAAQGGAASIVGSVEALPAVDAAVVAATTSAHASAVEALLSRRIPVYVEKPFTDDPESAERIARTAGDRVFVMDKWRYHPGIRMLAEMVRKEELGPVQGLCATRVQWGLPVKDDAVWRLLPHDLSIALEVLGTIPEPSAAVAEGTDGMSAICGGRPWFAARVSVREIEERREVRLCARDGVAVLSGGYSDHVQVLRLGGAVERRPIRQEMPLLTQLRAFLAHLDGGPAPLSSAADGARIVRVIARLRALAGLP